jgi:hypothetical protein
MKNLLDFYKESIQVDPEITEEDVLSFVNLSSKFQGVTGLDYLYHVYSTTVPNLQNYRIYRENSVPEYFKSVSGNKVVKIEGGNYIGVIDIWYPSEHCLFNLVHSPIMAGWVISDLLEKMDKVEDILNFSDPKKTLSDSIKNLLKVIEGTEFYGFWMGDSRNSSRKKPIKIRRLEVEKIELDDKYYYSNLYPDITMKDKDTREEIIFNSYNLDGWDFYLSKELLAERLKDIESFWMRGYDQRVKSLDYEVEKKRKELENLISKRKNFENGITEYQKKLHEILWKSF